MQGAGPGSYILWLAKCLFEIDFFEVNASLKGVPWQPKLVRQLHSKKKKEKKKKSQMLGLILQAWSGVLRKDIYQLFLDLNLSWKVSQFSIFACFSGKAISIVNSQFSLWIGSWSNRTVVDSYLSAWSLPSYLVMVLSPPELLSPLLGLCIWDLFLVMAWGWLAIEA